MLKIAFKVLKGTLQARMLAPPLNILMNIYANGAEINV